MQATLYLYYYHYLRVLVFCDRLSHLSSYTAALVLGWFPLSVHQEKKREKKKKEKKWKLPLVWNDKCSFEAILLLGTLDRHPLRHAPLDAIL